MSFSLTTYPAIAICPTCNSECYYQVMSDGTVNYRCINQNCADANKIFTITGDSKTGVYS